jgi:hypothetical protein
MMSGTISALKRCSVRLYLQLLVGWLMSYLRYLCLLAHSGVQHILCCVFICLRLVFAMLPVSLNCPFIVPSVSLKFINRANLWYFVTVCLMSIWHLDIYTSNRKLVSLTRWDRIYFIFKFSLILTNTSA